MHKMVCSASVGVQNPRCATCRASVSVQNPRCATRDTSEDVQSNVSGRIISRIDGRVAA